MSIAGAACIDDSFFADNQTARALVGLYEFLPGVIFFAKDRDSRFVAANQAMLAAKNLESSSELLGLTDRDFHPPALADAYIAEDRRVLELGSALPNQVWFVMDRAGRPGWFQSSKIPLPSRSGEVAGIAGVRYAIETPEELDHQFQAVAPALRHLEEHYTEQVSIGALSEMSGLSTSHFNRRFGEVLGMSPTQFIHSLRIEKARQLLAKTRRQIGEIALETGYFDQSHFTRHFRRRMGITPREYRVRFR